ncbi:acyltransferase family protein [Mucilaginibacter sp. NFX135]|uniref:acyltransferase family protein n=1 Tax=Mucilaginibacter sp. NFX135 TaxID=3402687 RepID=UPI003AFAC596
MRLSKYLNIFSDIKEIPEVLDQKIYPSLNGLRAIAVIMVVISHIAGHYKFLQPTVFLGYLGVNIFFVLSGFLITTLCIKEQITTKQLSLKNFYIRRALRILPVAYLYILVIVVLSSIFKLGVSKSNIFSSALFAANFTYFHKPHLNMELGHFWSLSLEEQFYLMFPFLLKKSFKVFMSFILFILVVLPIIIYLQSVDLLYNNGVAYALPYYLIKFQAISLGCLFSVLSFKGYLNWGPWRFLISAISLIIILVVQINHYPTPGAVFNNLFISTMTGFLIENSIYKSNDPLFKFFNIRIIALIGVLSYSVYIWQQLFLSHTGIFPISTYPYNFCFLIVVPCLSYFYYEKFFLKLKSRFTKRR